jgi:hypothetical protein
MGQFGAKKFFDQGAHSAPAGRNCQPDMLPAHFPADLVGNDVAASAWATNRHSESTLSIWFLKNLLLHAANLLHLMQPIRLFSVSGFDLRQETLRLATSRYVAPLMSE